MARDVVELLQELVRIPSVNPDGEPPSEHERGITGEGHLATHVAGFLRSLAAEVHFEEVRPHRPNVVGRFPVRGEPRARVLLAPHLDTVGVRGMVVDPFGGEIRDGRLYGRGASDTKGTMAAMLWALHERRDRLADSATEITFVGLMGEETGQPGSIDFGRNHPSGYDFAVVGEPTECRIVHAHKGCAWIEIDVLGLAAHASTPERGHSAILDAARLALALDAGWRPELEVAFSHPLFGAPTMNIGLIRGGTRANIVPDRAVLTLDLRTTPAFDDADPLAVLGAFIDRAIPGLRVHFSQTGRSKPLLTPAEDPMLGLLARATGAPLVTAPWFCDAAHLAAAGIPAVAAGPGSIAQAHTEDEWIALDALEDGVAFYGRFLDALA